MLPYKAAIDKLQHYIGKRTLITMPHGHQEMVAIFDWYRLTKASGDYDDSNSDSLFRDRADQIIEYHINEEILNMMNAKKWGLFAVVGVSGEYWEVEGFEDVAAEGALLFDLEKGSDNTCPVICAFSHNDYKPVRIVSRIEDLLIESLDKSFTTPRSKDMISLNE